jgi:hypothetical protein
MDKDKQIRKIKILTVQKLEENSNLVLRSLEALKLIKRKKRFTIIYPCQFCGRFVNYAFTPCLFCGNYPKNEQEAATAYLLSSNGYEKFDNLLMISRAIKDRYDLDLLLSNFRELRDEILTDKEKRKEFEPYFLMVKNSIANRASMEAKRIDYPMRSNILCRKCGSKLLLADTQCYNCALLNQQNGNYRIPENNLAPVQKWIVAMGNLLNFIENYLSNVDDKEGLEEIVFISVYIINRLVEKNELPGKNIRNLWRDSLRKTKVFYTHFGGDTAKGVIRIDDDKVKMEVLESCSGYEEVVIRAFGHNLSYLLKETK